MKRIWAPWRSEYIGSPDKGTCPFCTAPEDPATAHVVYSDETNIVLLNKYPYTGGHLLISPRRHLASLDDLDSNESRGMFVLTRTCVKVLKEAFSPHGFNIGMNLGRVAGAGIADHVHLHVVPRWKGDTNFMPVLSDTRVLSSHLDETYGILKPLFDKAVAE